jgi:AbrB family looped-hinge helix DNA binding protein
VAKVTSKLQVTLPKALAQRYGIEAGDQIEWEAAGDAIRVVPVSGRPPGDPSARLRLFDRATKRQQDREQAEPARAAESRGWTREELYERRAR